VQGKIANNRTHCQLPTGATYLKLPTGKTHEFICTKGPHKGRPRQEGSVLTLGRMNLQPDF